jgi:hypothetical protein
MIFTLGQPQTQILLPVAFHIAGNTDVYHHTWFID